MQTVVFSMGKEEYGFDIKSVQEIVRLEKPSKIPNMPHYIEGIINLRGKLIPVLNLALKFNLQAQEDGYATRLIVLNIGEGKLIAVKADEVTEVLTLEEGQIEKAPDITADNSDNCLEGIAKLDNKLIILLDTRKIIEAEEIGFVEEVI